MQYARALALLGFERNASNAPHPSFDSHWASRLDQWAGAYCAYAYTPGAALRLPVEGRGFLTVLFSPWSGILELEAGGQSLTIDMFGEHHRLGEIELPGAGSRLVTVRLAAHRNPASRGNEAWIHEFRAVARQAWLSRVNRLSPALNSHTGTAVTS